MQQQLDQADWTASQIDAMASDDGKNALHMAAWTGCMENVTLLLEFGCNINAIATGTYSYGKTPLFFAATRSRDDMVTFLLKRGAHVKILNNKGQSVLSIASSHLQPHTITHIQQAELDQTHLAWRNYRITHSDQLEYGDLDPRFFFERPLQKGSDVVAPLAINPTTKQSRRGGFQRRNPHLAPPLPPSSSATTKPNQPKQPKQQHPLSMEEERKLALAWKALEGETLSTEALWTILRLSDQRRQPWIVEAANQLRHIIGSNHRGDENDDHYYDCHELFQQARIECNGDGENSRRALLLERLRIQTFGTATGNCNGSASAVLRDVATKPQVVQPNRRRKLVFSTAWTEAYQHVAHLSVSALIQEPEQCLQLPEPPVFVDTIEQLYELRRLAESEPLVAFDTEWASSSSSLSVPNPSISTHVAVVSHISTVQLSWNHRAWVMEALQGDAHYLTQCRSFVAWLFQSKLMLGFALGKDIPMLEAWLGQSLDLSHVLDLQVWWTTQTTTTTTTTTASGGDVPGLARCTREVVGSHPVLSKAEQRSNWDRRPLSASQLVYAGMDAAVLPALLAERTRRLLQESV